MVALGETIPGGGTLSRNWHCRQCAVYPRPRGGTTNVRLPLGLSPPTRGNLQRASQRGVYPRPRNRKRLTEEQGLSPPTRGNRLPFGSQHIVGSIPAQCRLQYWVYPRPRGGTPTMMLGYVCHGSIPAHAGEPVLPCACLVGRREVNRICGLSPPTRGNPIAWPSCRTLLRSIPAHAGEPLIG